MSRFSWFGALVTLLFSTGTMGDVASVAVAANFTLPMKRIATDFEQATGHQLRISYGSTGKLYTQILHGAPFDLFLAADKKRPAMLVKNGRATDVFTYAVGKLILWGANNSQSLTDGEILRRGSFNKLAIANPKTAPYGAAALDVMKTLGVLTDIQPRLVQGDSIAQTYQFVATGNASLGFIAKSQLTTDAGGAYWEVPQNMYAPIEQGATLLDNGKDNAAARTLMSYLRSDRAKALIESFGYEFK